MPRSGLQILTLWHVVWYERKEERKNCRPFWIQRILFSLGEAHASSILSLRCLSPPPRLHSPCLQGTWFYTIFFMTCAMHGTWFSALGWFNPLFFEPVGTFPNSAIWLRKIGLLSSQRIDATCSLKIEHPGCAENQALANHRCSVEHVLLHALVKYTIQLALQNTFSYTRYNRVFWAYYQYQAPPTRTIFFGQKVSFNWLQSMYEWTYMHTNQSKKISSIFSMTGTSVIWVMYVG